MRSRRSARCNYPSPHGGWFWCFRKHSHSSSMRKRKRKRTPRQAEPQVEGRALAIYIKSTHRRLGHRWTKLCVRVYAATKLPNDGAQNLGLQVGWSILATDHDPYIPWESRAKHYGGHDKIKSWQNFICTYKFNLGSASAKLPRCSYVIWGRKPRENEKTWEVAPVSAPWSSPKE